MASIKIKEPGVCCVVLACLCIIFLFFSYHLLKCFWLLTLTHKCHSTEPQFYRLEGVWLTESGMSLLRSISMSPLHKRRQRRSRLGTLCCDGGSDGMELKEIEGDGEEGKGWHTLPVVQSSTNILLVL